MATRTRTLLLQSADIFANLGPFSANRSPLSFGGYGDGLNWYNYVGSDPINNVDPTGLCSGHGVSGPVNCGGVSRGGNVGDIVVIGNRIFPTIGSFGYNAGNQIVVRANKLSSFVPWGRGDGGHIYNVPRTLLCNGAEQDCDISKVDSTSCVVPGHSGGAPINNGQVYSVGFGFQPFFGGVPIVPAGLVTTTKSPNGLRFRNSTTVAHPLSGTVDRIFDVSANGSIFVTTIGQGDAFLPTDTINELFGPALFTAQNQQCAKHLGR